MNYRFNNLHSSLLSFICLIFNVLVSEVIFYFRGIITALIEFKDRLIDHNIKIFVRRAGPNYQEGLRRMREVGQTLGKII